MCAKRFRITDRYSIATASYNGRHYTKREIGIVFETYARKMLDDEGYDTIEQSYTCRHGEIDLIVKKGNLIVFVEVKARRESTNRSPEFAISKNKFLRILKCANTYLRELSGTHGVDLDYFEFRFDAVAIVFENLGHIVSCKHYMDFYSVPRHMWLGQI